MTAYTPPPYTVPTLLYVDDALLVVEKPAGLLSVPGRGDDKQDCLISRVQAEFPDALIVHRLDMGTSGLMLLARGKAVERALSILFQQRRVHKRYQALVAGKFRAESGEITLPLMTDWVNRPRQKVCWEQGKPSLTRYRVLEYDAARDASRVDLEPVTGRSHQLRVHLQALGHPIWGDDLYASAEIHAKASRLLLHACAIAFPHPLTGEAVSVNSAVPF